MLVRCISVGRTKDEKRKCTNLLSSFIEALEKYDANGDNETIQEFINLNKNKQLDEVKILGVMLTGQTQNFKALENQDFVRGASVGVTAQIVPYINTEK